MTLKSLRGKSPIRLTRIVIETVNSRLIDPEIGVGKLE
jgi:hypothetical protein